MEKFYTIKELAEALKVTELTVRRWRKSGKLKSTEIGGVIRISETQLLEFLESKGKK